MDTIAFFPALFKMLSALAIVLGILVGGAFYVKRFFLQTASDSGDGTAINVLATRYLGPKSSIMLIDVLGQVVVVGVSNNQMSFITTISDPDAREKIKGLGGKGREFPTLLESLTKYGQKLSSRKPAGKDGQGA